MESTTDEFDLVDRGYSHQLAERFGFSGRTLAVRMRKVLMLLAVTWLPMALMSLISRHAFGDRVVLPFFRDLEVHARFLLAIPMLELGEIVVGLSLRVQARHLVERGIVAPQELPAFRAAQQKVIWLRDSVFSELTILILSLAISLLFREVLGVVDGTSSWERVDRVATLAGWWHMLVSLPLLYFFLFRWVFVLIVWSRFLYLVSRLHLELTPTHPDHVGGLGFLAWGLASFSTVLMATSVVCSAGFAAEILHHGESLNSLKYHVAAFVVIAIIMIHAPLLAFSGQLARCRFTGLLKFGALVWQHDREFDEKWLSPHPDENRERILGSSDVQSMADIATCYEHINDMRLIPYDMKALVVLVFSALIPMVPLLATAIPLQEIFMKLGELLV